MNQALIQDRRNPELSLLAASQTKDKEALTEEGVTRVIRELQKSFDFVVCDSPAGIESGEGRRLVLCITPPLFVPCCALRVRLSVNTLPGFWVDLMGGQPRSAKSGKRSASLMYAVWSVIAGDLEEGGSCVSFVRRI